MPVYACPRCDAPSSPEHCPACGRGPEPLLVDLAALDADLATRRDEEGTLLRRADILRGEIAGLERNRSSVLRRLAERAAILRGQKTAGPAAPSPMPPPIPPGVPHPMAPQAPTPGATPPAPPGAPTPPGTVPGGAGPVPSGAPALYAPGAPGPTPVPPGAPGPVPFGGPGQAHSGAGPVPFGAGPVPPAEQSTRSVQTILLTLGGILFGAAAIIFTAVAWATFGLAGRAIILSVITLVTLIAPFVLMRRKLTATAETIGTVGLVLTFCDAIAVHYLDLLPGASGRSDQPGILVLLVLVTAVALGYRFVSGLVAPAFTVPVFAIPAGFVAGLQESRVIGVAGLLVLAGLLASASAVFGRSPGRTPRRAVPVMIGVPAAMAVIATAFAAVLGAQTIELGLTALAAVAVAALIVTHRVAPPWRLGATVGAWIVAGYTAIASAVACLALAVLGIRWDGSDNTPFAWQYPLALAAVGVTASFFAPRGTGRSLRYVPAGLAVTALPAAFNLSWRVGAVGVALVAVALAIVSVTPLAARPDRPWLRGAALGLATFASLTAAGDSTMFAAVTGGLALVSAALAVTTRGTDAVTPFATVAIVGAAIAQPSALTAAGVPSVVAALVMCATIAVVAAVGAGWIAVAAAAETTNWRLARWVSTGIAAAGLITSLAAGAILVEEAGSGRVFLTPTTLLLAAFGMVALAFAPSPTSNRWAVAASAVAVLNAAGTTIAVGLGGEDLLIHTGLTALLAVYLTMHRSTVEVLRRGLVWAGLAVGGACAGVAAIEAIEAWAVAAGIGETSIAGWRTPVVLLIVAAALAILPSWRPRFDAPAWAVVAALGCVPAVWLPDVWWSASAIAAVSGAAMIVATAFAPSRAIATSRLVIGVGVHIYGAVCAATGDTSAQRWGLAAAVVGVTLAAGTGLAVAARASRDRLWGGVGTALAIATAPIAVLFAGVAADWPRELVTPSTLGAAAGGLLAAGILRARGSDYLRWATATVPVAATGAALTALPLAESGVYTAVSGLIGLGAAMLMLPDRRPAMIRTGLSAIPVTITALLAAPLAVESIVRPYTWLGSVGARTPSSTIDGLSPEPVPLWGTGWDTIGLTIAGVAAVLAAVGLARRWWFPATVTAVAVVVPTIPVVLDAPWPLLPVASTMIGIAAYLFASCRPVDGGRTILTVVIAAVVGGSGVAGALADSAATAGVLGAVAVAGVIAALAGATLTARVIGWPVTAVALTGTAAAIGAEIGLPRADTAFVVLGIAAVLLAVAASRAGVLRGAERSAESSGWFVGLVAVLTASPTMPHLAVAVAALGAAAGLLALRTGPDRRLLLNARPYAWIGAGLALVAYWLLISDHNVSIVELYTVPPAAITLLFGWWEFRRRPSMRSWVAFGPALAVAFLPTFALALTDLDDPARRLYLGGAALVLLLVGVWRRLQAPVAVGASTLILLALWEIVQVWRSVPFWAPLAVAGLLLLIVGATFEKRRQDVRRLARTLASMR